MLALYVFVDEWKPILNNFRMTKTETAKCFGDEIIYSFVVWMLCADSWRMDISSVCCGPDARALCLQR